MGCFVDEIYESFARSTKMKLLIKLASMVLLAAMLFWPVQAVAAKGPVFDGQVIFGQLYTLASGETLNGDLLVFGGSAVIEQGATVKGNAVVFGGDLEINGDVTGDAAVFGGTIKLGATAHVYGNVSIIGSTLERADGAQVDGQINNASIHFGDGQNGTPAEPAIPSIPSLNFNFNPFGEVANILGQAFGLAVLAMLVMLFLAPHADRVAHAVIAQPLIAGGLGLLTLIVAPLALLLLIVTVILIPVAVIAVVVLAVAAVFGWIAVGYEIGQRFTKAIHQNWHPAFSAGVGVFALTLVSATLTNIPVLNCVGWLVPFLLGLAAFGAVVITRFGTQSVSAPAVSTPGPAAPEAPLPPPSDESKDSDKPG
jgi:cytoskeletal protein CcmA (bactofilin family)